MTKETLTELDIEQLDFIEDLVFNALMKDKISEESYLQMSILAANIAVKIHKYMNNNGNS